MHFARPLCAAVAALTLAACSSAGDTAPPAPAPAPAGAGTAAFYTASQADEGQSLFQDYCSGCHGPTDFHGAGFLGAWGGRSAHDLFSFMSQNMPKDSPGLLEDQQYTTIMAYVFELNGMPAGGERLTPDEELLRSIRLPAS